MKLYPYQQEGVGFLAARRRALLADEMGLGKSAQAIVACDKRKAQRVLVICPASLRENWRREFSRFQTESRPICQPDVVAADESAVMVTSYDKALRNVQTWRAHQYDALILDEAHYLKTKGAKRTQAIFGKKCDGKGGIIERAKACYALTGTPMPNHPAELWPMLRAMAPSRIQLVNGRPAAYWPFVNKFCKTFDNGFGIQITGAKNVPELRDRLEVFALRRRKSEVLTSLPPLQIETLPLTNKQALKALKSIERGDEVSAITAALEEGGEALYRMAPHVASLRRLTGEAKAPAVIEWIAEWFAGGGGKLVVFAHHIDVIGRLGQALGEFNPSIVTGACSPGGRQGDIDSFQEDPRTRLFIGQIQAAGVGLTLTASSDVLFAESSWVPTENEQAAMRIHRIGQRNACTVRFATLAGSLDERIQQVAARKLADIKRLFD